MRLVTVGHGTRPVAELVAALHAAGVATLVDVRRFPGSRRHPQFNRGALAATLGQAAIDYVHEPDLGGRRSGVEGEELFSCLHVAAFRSYAAWMRGDAFLAALSRVLERPAPCVMCAETVPWRCHRRLIADLVVARGGEVVHVLEPGSSMTHRGFAEAEMRDGKLYVCGALVA